MNAREANVLLTQAALLDPRMKRADPDEQAGMATIWAELLADIALTDALEAMRDHYRTQHRPLMPADLLERLRPKQEPDYGLEWIRFTA